MQWNVEHIQMLHFSPVSLIVMLGSSVALVL